MSTQKNILNPNLPDPLNIFPFGTMRYSSFAIDLINICKHNLHMTCIFVSQGGHLSGYLAQLQKHGKWVVFKERHILHGLCLGCQRHKHQEKGYVF